MLIEQKEFLEKDGSIGYIESIFNSGNILKCIFFPKMEKLYIAFNRGNTYSYMNISLELYNEFINAESQGKFFHSRIFRNKDYPYNKEFTLYPTEINEIKKIVETKLNNDEY
jgi:hypothetical protein